MFVVECNDVVVLYEGVYDGDDLLVILLCFVLLLVDVVVCWVMLEIVLCEMFG